MTNEGQEPSRGDTSRLLCRSCPLLVAEGHFVICDFTDSRFVPLKKVERATLEKAIRTACTAHNPKPTQMTQANGRIYSGDIAEFEMISLRTADEADNKVLPRKEQHSDTARVECSEVQQKRKHEELLKWLLQEDNDFVYLETFSLVQDVMVLFDSIRTADSPILLTLLVSNTVPVFFTVSMSRVKIDMHQLLFCMFQA